MDKEKCIKYAKGCHCEKCVKIQYAQFKSFGQCVRKMKNIQKDLKDKRGIELAYGRIYKMEIVTHLSKTQILNRILKTKKYIRLKICI